MKRSTGRVRFTDPFALLAVGLVLVFGLLPGSSRAATPPSGTVSETTLSVAWTGPFKAATASATCDGPNDPACDNFQLNIVPPSAAFGPFIVEIKLTPALLGDWDMQVYLPGGGAGPSSGNSPGQVELVTLSNPAAGTYTVAAAPFAPAVGPDVNGDGLPDSYSATATIKEQQVAPPPPPGENITYFNHVPPAPLGQPGSDEPSIGCNYKSDNVMFIGALETYRVGFDDCSSPAQDTWQDVSFVTTSLVSLDPILFTDRLAGRTFVSQLSAKCSSMAFTDDDGASWTPSQGCGINSGVDHQTVGGGPFHAPLTRDPEGLLYPNAVYYCSQDIAIAQCARSDTGGLTFGPAIPVYDLSECGGLHGHIKVSDVPGDIDMHGIVYLPNKGCNGEQAVVVSEDSGLTWEVRKIPGSVAGQTDPSVGVARDGSIYFGWDNGGVEAMVAVSRNKGDTWENYTNVGAPFGVTNTVFPAVVAGDPDRAAFAFHGSDGPPGGGGDDPNWPGDWYLYVAHTYDGGLTWTTVNAAPNDPVQRGTICTAGINCNNGTRNLLDFFGAEIDRFGRVLVGYADGCIGDCVKGRPNSFTARSTIARQVLGRRMYSQFDVVDVPSSPLATAAFDTCEPRPTAVVLSWTVPDDHGSPIQEYRIYRRTETGTFALLATVPSTGRSYTDGTIQPNEKYFYRVTAVNALGESRPCGEVAPDCPGGGKPEDSCIFPGKTVLTDGTNDFTALGTVLPRPEWDIVKLSITEPGDLGPGKIMFVLKMVSMQNPPEETTWPILFKSPNPPPNGTDFAARMHTDAAGQVFFTVATGANNTNPILNPGTPADPTSGFSPDGNIRIVVPRSAIGNPQPAQHLTDFIVRIRFEGGGVALTPDNMPDSLARAGSYKVVGSETCVCNAPDAVDDAATTEQNSPVVISILANDSDGGAPPLAVDVTQPSNGIVTDNGDGTVTYRPDSGFIGTDSFDYTVRNACGATDTATVRVTVNERRVTCLEDDDARIEYDNGWHMVSDPEASAGHFRLNTGKDNPPHAMTFAFDVPAGQVGQLTYYFATSPKGGTADVYIDGIKAGDGISYAGSNGKTRDPDFCGDACTRTYTVTAGPHTFELRAVRDAVYVDRFCLENSSDVTSQPTSGPGPTTSSVNVLAAAQELLSSLGVPGGTLEISVMAEPGINAPIRLVLIDPTGSILQTAETTSGFAVIEKSVTQSGLYLIKVVNLGLGPVEVWTVATPLVAR